LDHHVTRLAEDHANAKRLAAGLAHIAGLRIDAANVETNLVYFSVTAPGWDAEKLCDAVRAHDVRIGAMGSHILRAVTHLDVDAAGIDRALSALREVLR